MVLKTTLQGVLTKIFLLFPSKTEAPFTIYAEEPGMC